MKHTQIKNKIKVNKEKKIERKEKKKWTVHLAAMHRSSVKVLRLNMLNYIIELVLGLFWIFLLNLWDEYEGTKHAYTVDFISFFPWQTLHWCQLYTTELLHNTKIFDEEKLFLSNFILSFRKDFGFFFLSFHWWLIENIRSRRIRIEKSNCQRVNSMKIFSSLRSAFLVINTNSLTRNYFFFTWISRDFANVTIFKH